MYCRHIGLLVYKASGIKKENRNSQKQVSRSDNTHHHYRATEATIKGLSRAEVRNGGGHVSPTVVRQAFLPLSPGLGWCVMYVYSSLALGLNSEEGFFETNL